MTQTLTKNNNNQTVALKLGEKLTIALPGNPTTGYTWTRAGYFDAEKAQNLSCEGLEVSKAYGQGAAPAGMCGVGGTFTFDVSVKKPGSHDLEFVYARPWEGASSAAETFKVHIDAQ